MKIAFIYGPFCLGGHGQNAFDASRLWDDPRGMTGSELSFFRLASETAKRGHDVTVYTFFNGQPPAFMDGFKCRPFSSLQEDAGSGWDVAYSWNEPDPLRAFPASVLRMVNLQINSFTHCRPGFENFVDVWTSPSEAHRERILSMDHPSASDYGQVGTYHPEPEKWVTLRNGCDPSIYDSVAASGVQKVPGRVIWASSPDRGLHWVFRMWPEIRRAVPHAHLKVFYKIDAWFGHFLENPAEFSGDTTLKIQMSRARYAHEALRRLHGQGVELVKSVSRVQIAREMVEAEVLAYPCDPASWTEGFSVTLMEGCASGAVPVTTDVDALGSVYGGSVPMVKSPVGDRIGEFKDYVVRLLTDPEYRSGFAKSARDLADRHSWSLLAAKLEEIVSGRIRKAA